MQVAKRSAAVTPEVNLRECILCRPLPSANKPPHSAFETQRRRHKNSETGVSVAPQKGLVSSKNFLKNLSSSVTSPLYARTAMSSFGQIHLYISTDSGYTYWMETSTLKLTSSLLTGPMWS